MTRENFNQPMRRLARTMLLALAAGAALGGSTAGKAAQPKSPVEVAVQFLQSFADKDMETVRSLFAPGALVQRARLSGQGGPPELASFQAGPWADESERGVAQVQDFKIEVLETNQIGFGEGQTVSLRFRATGKVGNGMAFVNNGVDTFSLVQVEGAWRILLYNSIEQFQFQ
ncbi:MAG: nuclear transport factor 2 family protein [Acidobacteriota bacterium]